MVERPFRVLAATVRRDILVEWMPLPEISADNAADRAQKSKTVKDRATVEGSVARVAKSELFGSIDNLLPDRRSAIGALGTIHAGNSCVSEVPRATLEPGIGHGEGMSV